MFFFIFLIIFVFGTPVIADYDDAIYYYNSKQFKKSIKEFKKVVDNDLVEAKKKSDAMYNLAVIYDNGIGVDQNKEKALHWYKLASDSNHKIAQFNLAWMFYNGEKIEKNNFEAFKYYSLSAEQGYAKAQFNLGNLLYAGEGVLKDYVLAYKWFKISLLNGIKESENFLNKVVIHMHQDEVEAADKEVEDWLKNYSYK
jgi:uncharacterized protein